MFKGAHKGHFIDRNADIPAAGVPVMKDEKALRDCLDIGHPEELADSLVGTQECGHREAKCSHLREGSFLPNNSVGDLLTVELQKSRFASFKERFYEELFFKRAHVGEIQPAYSKPDSVTNMSRTFGRPSSLTPTASLYSLIMPMKSREQVDAEYKEFHEKRIVSHNNYFAAEQINRKYTPPFDRLNPCGKNHTIGDSGLKVKSCLTLGENHLKVIGKAQVDFMERTVAPLGKKFKKYLYEVPDITFGLSQPSNGDVKMVLYNIVSGDQTELLMDAISHVNMIRLQLRKRDDIQLHQLIKVLEQSDPGETGLLPLDRLLEILRKYRIRMEPQMIRIVVSHYHMIVDKGLCSEGVKYREFCKLLSSHEPLPPMGGVATYGDVSSQDTTYRLFCADRDKKLQGDAVLRVQKDRDGMKELFSKFQKNKTEIKELLSPDLDALGGLQASDFTQLRAKVEIKKVFRNLMTKDEFEVIWQSLMAKYQDQEGLASVRQFHEEMKLAK